jgi:hypothetical protein
MALAVLNAERIRGYAEHWRSLARGWARLAGKENTSHARHLRHAAQMALYGAFEAERLLRVSDDWTAPAMPAADVPRRHGPIGYVAALGPVALAGQRPRSGPPPHARRRASGLG